MSKEIMVWNDQKDELLWSEILLFEPYKFKARTRTNSLDESKVDARAVRERYGVIKARFETKEKEGKRASGVNPEVTHLGTALEKLIERE